MKQRKGMKVSSLFRLVNIGQSVVALTLYCAHWTIHFYMFYVLTDCSRHWLCLFPYLFSFGSLFACLVFYLLLLILSVILLQRYFVLSSDLLSYSRHITLDFLSSNVE